MSYNALSSQISLIVAGEISVHSKVAEGSIFAFFIPVSLSALPVHHEAISRAREIHHSLHDQTSAPSDIAFDVPKYEVGTMAQTSPRARRVSRSHAETGTIHVLLVEDNEISQKLLKKQLIRAGCSVATANDGVEAVEFLLENSSVDRVINSAQSTGVRGARVELILMGGLIPLAGLGPAYTARYRDAPERRYRSHSGHSCNGSKRHIIEPNPHHRRQRERPFRTG